MITPAFQHGTPDGLCWEGLCRSTRAQQARVMSQAVGRTDEASRPVPPRATPILGRRWPVSWTLLPCEASVQPVESSGHSCGPGAPLPSVIRLRCSPPGRQVVPLLVTLFQMKRLGWILKAGGDPPAGEGDQLCDGQEPKFLLHLLVSPIRATLG